MLKAMVEVMKEAYNRSWITTRDGNCALSNHGKFYITPSAQRKNVLRVEDIIKYKIDEKGKLKCTKDGITPSIEFESHYGLHLLLNKKVVSTLHLHPTNVVAAMYAGWDLQGLHNYFAELHRYTSVGKTVSNLPPGDVRLAKETIDNMQKEDGTFFNIVGQEGHGVMAIGKNPWDAFEHIERLDHICKVVLASGVKPNSK